MLNRLRNIFMENDNLYEALDLSYFIIKKLYEKNNISYLPTNMKLQKLLYFCQGYALAKLNKPIINAEFQAWMNGPVIPEVWHKFKFFGTGVISNSTLSLVNTVEIKSDVEKLIDNIIDEYGHFAPYELSGLTHKDNTAWSKIRNSNKLMPGESSRYVIPNKFITEEFKNYIKG